MIDQPNAAAGNNHGGRLRLGQTVELTRGVLAGMRGVLESFRPPRWCLLRLNVAEDGVLLLIDVGAVKEFLGERATAAGPPAKDGDAPHDQ